MVKKILVAAILFFIIWYILKALMRLAGLFSNDYMNKQSGTNKQTTQKNGVTIEYNGEPKKRFEKNEGEYVDYEEVK